MKDFVIVTDSSCDLGNDLRTKHGIDYIKMTVLLEDKEFVCDLDWQELSCERFYQSMEQGAKYRTTQITIPTYLHTFESYLKAGKDILYLAMSTGLSGSHNSSRLAAEELRNKYPGSKIFCIDTLRASLGEGLIAVKAAEMKKAGKTIEEIAAWVEQNRNCVHQVGSVSTLAYLKRAGRVTGAAAVMGNIFNIKPIIISNTKGENFSIEKVRGRKGSFRRSIEYIKENVIEPEKQTLYLVQANCLEEIKALRDEIMAQIPFKDSYINTVGMVIGSSVGPGMYGVYFHGKAVKV